MRSVRFLFVLLTAMITFAALLQAKADQDKDFAVPAYSDLALVGGPEVPIHRLAANPFEGQLKPLPDVERLRYFDLNQDLQLNDFDIKQFQSIVENLHGDRLSGLQLIIQFRKEQKNQKESFPLLYDLDRDGMFTPYDVDFFTDMVNKLDKGASRGGELVQSLKMEIFPQDEE